MENSSLDLIFVVIFLSSLDNKKDAIDDTEKFIPGEEFVFILDSGQQNPPSPEATLYSNHNQPSQPQKSMESTLDNIDEISANNNQELFTLAIPSTNSSLNETSLPDQMEILDSSSSGSIPDNLELASVLDPVTNHKVKHNGFDSDEIYMMYDGQSSDEELAQDLKERETDLEKKEEVHYKLSDMQSKVEGDLKKQVNCLNQKLDATIVGCRSESEMHEESLLKVSMLERSIMGLKQCIDDLQSENNELREQLSAALEHHTTKCSGSLGSELGSTKASSIYQI